MHREDRDALARHMAWLMSVAAVELRCSDPTRLYQRFLGWALPKDQLCRLCGKRGHDAIPGVPPRLIPCEIAARLSLAAPDDAGTCGVGG
jgi:hypothetical protein